MVENETRKGFADLSSKIEFEEQETQEKLKEAKFYMDKTQVSGIYTENANFNNLLTDFKAIEDLTQIQRIKEMINHKEKFKEYNTVLVNKNYFVPLIKFLAKQKETTKLKIHVKKDLPLIVELIDSNKKEKTAFILANILEVD